MSKELKETIERERALYIPHIKSLKNKLMALYTHAEEFMIFCYICALRRAEYYQNRSKLMYVYWIRRANLRGERLGFSIPAGVLGEGVLLYHPGVVINQESEIGAGCRFHGDNCVGNNGKDNRCPKLGMNVDVGVGAKIIGGVTIADGIKIGANAVVTRSFSEPGVTIAGIPAREL